MITRWTTARAVTAAVALVGALLAVVSAPAAAQTSDLVITGVVDGPLSGGVPKAVELYATADIADLSAYGIGSANNGGGSDGEELTLSGSATAGDHIYVASEATGFDDFFGFPPDFTSEAASINGDDAVELFMNGAVIDVFGEIATAGGGEPWEYTDGWAYRLDGTGPDGSTFVPASWTFSGPDALDGETTNDAAAAPFPIGTYQSGGGTDPAPGDLVVTEVMQNPAAVADGAGEWFEVANVSGQAIDIDGWTISDGGTDSHVIANGGPLEVPAGGYVVLGVNGDSAANGGVTVDYAYSGFILANGDDEVVLTDAGGTIWDEVAYDGGPAFPDPDGASMNLDPGSTAVSANDDGANWCEATDPYGDGDLGTPGAANSACEPDPPAETELISAVQGSGSTVAISGPVQVQGVVIGLFEDADVLDGFFVQEEDADADGDPQTSEGIFVFCRGNCAAALAVGDLVTVAGDATEFFGMSQIDVTGAGGSVTIDSSSSALPAPTAVTLPAAGPTDENGETTFEQYEGMHVVFPGELVVSEYFELARYGQLVLTAVERPYQFTHDNAPSTPGYQAFLDDLATRRIILDDLDNDQNEVLGPPDEPYFHPEGGLSTTNRFRGGDSITDLTGVLHWSFAGQSGTDAWRVRPIPSEHDYAFTPENPAPGAPGGAGGDVQVASFNVLNYFTTVDDGSTPCGPTGGQECRGADSTAELDRQRDKIVAALADIDADVVGLIEIQNDDGASVADLVAALDAAGAATYDYVDTGSIGTDAIKVAFIYQPATVTPVGSFAVLDSSVDPDFDDTKNRPALIQTFEEAGGGRFTVAVNHLKSKGSPCDDVGDPDLGDGQGNCSQTRREAAIALAEYLETDPTGSSDPDVLIIGDLNSYATEETITELESREYTDLIEAFGGPGAYSYVFDGQLGYLDHALANAALLDQVTGVVEWHVNADEVPLFDYNDPVQDPAEASFERESDALPLYEPDPRRSSDHDPVVVGLDLAGGGDPVLSCGGVSGTEAELTAMGYDVHVGTDGDDVLDVQGGLRRDFVVAMGGADVIRTGLRGDVVCAGDGADTVFTGIGNDTVEGGAGIDLVDGGLGADDLDGGDDGDVLFGVSGDDTIDGGGGDDMAFGGPGRDSLTGGEGSDRLFGEASADALSGGPGTDLCDGGPGRDSEDGTCEAVTSIP